MCRLMAVPPKMKRGDVLDILLDMEGRNTDGFGFAYTDSGKFILNKTALSLTECLRKKKAKNNIWNNFPEHRKGWVILHMRAATHGEVCAKNAHPFIAGNVAWVHNGVFRECEIVRAAMGKELKLQSQTDSEIALHFYNKVGPKRFVNLVGGSSVFLALNKDGSLWALKTAYGADLKIAKLSKKICFLASSLPYSSTFKHEEADDGWHYFNRDGYLVDHAEKKDEDKPKHHYKTRRVGITYQSIDDHSDSEYGEAYYLEQQRLKKEKERLRMLSVNPFSSSPQHTADAEMPLGNFRE